MSLDKRQDKFAQSAREQVRLANYAKVATIYSIDTNGYYTVKLLSGELISFVPSLNTGIKYFVGQSVTIEEFGGDWAIGGISAYKGGD